MKNNNWIKLAAVLGISFFIAIFLVKPIGVSTQYSVLTGIIHSSIDKDIITVDESRESGYKSTNAYYDKSEGKLAKSIKHPWNYDFVFVLAIPVGSLLGYVLMKNRRKEEETNENKCIDGKCELEVRDNSFKEYLVSFAGGFILLYGARMADGCTSGHMMSGMMQGSVSGYVFAAAAFATAIPTAIIVKRMKNK